MESVVMDRYNSYTVYPRRFASMDHRGVMFKPFNSLPNSNQPPLLPLPSLNSTSHGSSPRRVVSGHQPRWKKPRPCSSSPKKEGKARVVLSFAQGKEEEEKEERVEWVGSLYSVSPPPSSVPMPSFSVARGRGRGGEGGGVDACATGELRRLLGL